MKYRIVVAIVEEGSSREWKKPVDLGIHNEIDKLTKKKKKKKKILISCFVYNQFKRISLCKVTNADTIRTGSSIIKTWPCNLCVFKIKKNIIHERVLSNIEEVYSICSLNIVHTNGGVPRSVLNQFLFIERVVQHFFCYHSYIDDTLIFNL